MRKIAEKVALVALIAIAVIFVLTALLYMFGIVPQVAIADSAVVIIIMAVLTVAFVGLAIYLLYMNFSEAQNLKRLLLYADSQSATTTTIKVVNKIAKGCTNKVEGVRIRKTKIRSDEKNGYTATFAVEVSVESVSPVLEQLRCLIEEAFQKTLGLQFNTIKFDMVKYKGKPAIDEKKVENKKETIVENNEDVKQAYQNPDQAICQNNEENVVVEEKPVEQAPVEEKPKQEVVVEEKPVEQNDETPVEEKPEEKPVEEENN